MNTIPLPLLYDRLQEISARTASASMLALLNAQILHAVPLHAVNEKLNSDRTNLSCVCCRAWRARISTLHVELCALELGKAE